MNQYPFRKIDAFAAKRSGGNPAGCIYIKQKDELNEKQMHQIAVELKGFVNEVGFISPLGEDRFHLQFYSAERRVDFCGHAIIGIMYDLIKNNSDLEQRKQIKIVTDKGESIIKNKIKSDDAIYVTAPAAKAIPVQIWESELCNVLKIKPDCLNRHHPVEMINAGLNTLIVPINGLHVLVDILPDIQVLKHFCLENQIDIVTVYTEEVFMKKNHFRSRVFAPTFGYLEDPATGSGNSALGYYLLKHKIWNGENISIEQNGMLEEFNLVKLNYNKNERKVIFGGAALTRIIGKYCLYTIH